MAKIGQVGYWKGQDLSHTEETSKFESQSIMFLVTPCGG